MSEYLRVRTTSRAQFMNIFFKQHTDSRLGISLSYLRSLIVRALLNNASSIPAREPIVDEFFFAVPDLNFNMRTIFTRDEDAFTL